MYFPSTPRRHCRFCLRFALPLLSSSHSEKQLFPKKVFVELIFHFRWLRYVQFHLLRFEFSGDFTSEDSLFLFCSYEINSILTYRSFLYRLVIHHFPRHWFLPKHGSFLYAFFVSRHVKGDFWLFPS